jgi:hypothetical protein
MIADDCEGMVPAISVHGCSNRCRLPSKGVDSARKGVVAKGVVARADTGNGTGVSVW